MDYLGANIYYWGRDEQRRLLLDGVRPWALEARRRNLAEHFWYCVFDARGPHVFALFATPAGQRPALREFLDCEIRSFLLARPSAASADAENIERRHLECRGKTLSVADREEGLAPNNSFALFDHDPQYYPLWISSGMAGAGEFWRRVDRLAFWALDRLDRRGLETAALGWLAAADRSLAERGLPAEAYWRLHATSLIPALAERLKSEEQEVKASLPRIVGERNSAAFSKVWDAAARACEQETGAAGLVQLVTAEDGRSLQQRYSMLRELNHFVLAQLSQAVKLQIPIILYAWHCSWAR